MLELGKYSIGTGDRFMHQGRAQLRAVVEACQRGREIIPVWNKSYREHTIVKTKPDSLRREADAAVQALHYRGPYFVDADHIGGSIVDEFLTTHDFFTLDLSDSIGGSIEQSEVDSFLRRVQGYQGTLQIAGLGRPIELDSGGILKSARLYLPAIKEAGRLYRHICAKKGRGNFITEISIDETAHPQTPGELFLILAAIAQEEIPLQTIAPKFSGSFCKGIDYLGDVNGFAQEFEADLAVVAFARQEFGLPRNLKLSVHSGSDKFSIYPAIHAAIEKHGAGLHLKTAGTTWLEELIGLAESGGEGLRIAQAIYDGATQRLEELCKPYLSVLRIRPENLPAAQQVRAWDGFEFARRLRHDPTCEEYNPDFRQLLHVSYKLAAEMGQRFFDALEANEGFISRNVTANLLDRHLLPVFFGSEQKINNAG